MSDKKKKTPPPPPPPKSRKFSEGGKLDITKNNSGKK
jgi:hypothetical protein